jgi:hypothetical protein
MIRGSIRVVEAGAATDDSSAGANAIVGANASNEPVPANVTIPTDKIAIAELGTTDTGSGEEHDIQRVSINLTDDGYDPAIIAVQAGMEVEWTINNTSASDENYTMLAPNYNTLVNLLKGENPLYLFPTEDFEFSNGDNTFYGYVRVLDDLSVADEQEIRERVAAFKTLIYPAETFASSAGDAPGCHQEG